MEVQIRATATVIHSADDHTAVEDLRHATCIAPTARAPAHVRLSAEDLLTDHLPRGDALQATRVVVLVVADLEAILFALVALEHGRFHALARGRCPTLVILAIVEAVAAQGR